LLSTGIIKASNEIVQFHLAFHSRMMHNRSHC